MTLDPKFVKYVYGIYGDADLDGRTIKLLYQVWLTNPQSIINAYNQKTLTKQQQQQQLQLQLQLVPSKPQTSTVEEPDYNTAHDDLSGISSFNEAFRIANQRKLKVFKWKPTKANPSGLFGTTLATSTKAAPSDTKNQTAHSSKKPQTDLIASKTATQKPRREVLLQLYSFAPELTGLESNMYGTKDELFKYRMLNNIGGDPATVLPKSQESTSNFSIDGALKGAGVAAAAGVGYNYLNKKNNKVEPHLSIAKTTATPKPTYKEYFNQLGSRLKGGLKDILKRSGKGFGTLSVVGYLGDLFPSVEAESAADQASQNVQNYGSAYGYDPMYRRMIDRQTAVYQQGGNLAMANQQLQQAQQQDMAMFREYLKYKYNLNSDQELANKLNTMDERQLELEYAEYRQALQQQQVQAAKFGAKLNYLKSLRGECPEGFETQYFKAGGQLCKKCIKKQMEKGGEMPEDPIDAFKCGGKKKKGKKEKKEQGGSFEMPTFDKATLAKCGAKLKEAACGAKLKKDACGAKLKKDACGSKLKKNACGSKMEK